MARFAFLVLATAIVGCHKMQLRRELDDPVGDYRSAPPDDKKPIRERIQEKREERKDRRDERKAEAAKDAPKLPPAVAADKPKDAEPPLAGRGDDLEPVRKIYKIAAERYAVLTDFEAKLVRQETVRGNQGPKEEVFFAYRKSPLSVYMKNVAGHGVGREVLYVKGQHDNLMYVLIDKDNANFLMKAGSVQKFKPDNPLVTSRSRKRIDEAGFGDSLTRFGRFIEEASAGRRPDGVKYLGPVQRPEYKYALDGVEFKLQPGDDPNLPKGGVKRAYFDMKADSPGYGVPVLITTYEPDGREVEYYCFTDIKQPAGLTDKDFHPDRLGKK